MAPATSDEQAIFAAAEQRSRAPLSTVVGLFICNGVTWFSVGVLVGHSL